MNKQQGKPGPHSELPPHADYWGWPLFGKPLSSIWRDGLASLGAHCADAMAMDAQAVGASADGSKSQEPARRAAAAAAALSQ